MFFDRVLPVAAVCGALALGGCGEEQLDMGKIEKGIKDGIEKQNPGTRVEAVDCPDDVEVKKGGTFDCKVKGAQKGQEATAKVTQTDDEGNVRYVVQ